MVKRSGRSKACVSCRRAKKKVSGDYSVERHAIVQGQITHVIVGVKQYTGHINILSWQ